MNTIELLDFANTLGREFSQLLRDAGFDDVSGHDCYSVVAAVIDAEVTPDALRGLDEQQLSAFAVEFNRFFECTTTTVDLVRRAIERTLWHWSK